MKYALFVSLTAAANVNEACTLTNELSDCTYDLLCLGPMKEGENTNSLCVKADQCDADFKPKNAEYKPDTGDLSGKTFETKDAKCAKPTTKGTSTQVCTADWMCDDKATPSLKCATFKADGTDLITMCYDGTFCGKT